MALVTGSGLEWPEGRNVISALMMFPSNIFCSVGSATFMHCFKEVLEVDSACTKRRTLTLETGNTRSVVWLSQQSTLL